MNILLHPTYFPNVAHFVSIIHSEKLLFEVHDNYQKQTYRNRTNIYAANGKLALTVPVIYSQKNRQLYRDIKIFNDDKWQALHWKSLQSAYRTSPFFEFYQDELSPLFHTNQVFLLDFNFKCLEVILECLQLDIEYETTQTFEKKPNNCLDYRILANARKEKEHKFESYTQVFSNKHGYINNLSILDLLFNEGTNTVPYLQSQKIQL
ncbi:WbqC family protein [Flavobacteriaceae bacterium S0825]|uniref:WbqC family protein n=1 Tax=Gaetbulibacter sp. S0825 TaxID=2720084 RepID=UPI00143225F1|nr:WbqC family protein [Gaetbulibacter sp. S0825]MCK0110088.1 WbqC family protein [Flavobacteriaceae bacterium S0825]NIX65717.1 WbqC family protein [Gaetbulibacter sp. S0825]